MCARTFSSEVVLVRDVASAREDEECGGVCPRVVGEGDLLDGLDVVAVAEQAAERVQRLPQRAGRHAVARVDQHGLHGRRASSSRASSS